MAAIPNSSARILERVTVARRLARGAVGLLLGWVWSSFVSLGWVGAAVVWYGNLDRALSELKSERWAVVAFASYFASVTGSWAGGVAGPVALGVNCRLRSPVLVSSLLGGMAGGLWATLIGVVVGWQMWLASPRSMLVLQVPLALGVPVGLAGGWLAAWVLSRRH